MGGILAQPVRFKAEVVADGKTGDHGTVLKGNDTAIFNLTMRSAGCSAYADQPSCDADNVTDAGCTWCDVVDRPPFCSSIFEAREQPLPPQGPPFTCSKYAPIGESRP